MGTELASDFDLVGRMEGLLTHDAGSTVGASSQELRTRNRQDFRALDWRWAVAAHFDKAVSLDIFLLFFLDAVEVDVLCIYHVLNVHLFWWSPPPPHLSFPPWPALSVRPLGGPRHKRSKH